MDTDKIVQVEDLIGNWLGSYVDEDIFTAVIVPEHIALGLSMVESLINEYGVDALMQNQSDYVESVGCFYLRYREVLAMRASHALVDYFLNVKNTGTIDLRTVNSLAVLWLDKAIELKKEYLAKMESLISEANLQLETLHNQ